MSRRALLLGGAFSAVFWSALIVWGIRSLTGCAAPDVVTIPRAPAWILPQDARPVTGAEVQAEAARLAPFARLTLRDDTYSRVSRAWLDLYVTWTWEATKATGIRYVPESFDCEDFATLFAAVARAKAAEAGQRTAPLIGILIVRTDGTATHALVVVATDGGVVVVEPQPDAGPFRIRPLDDYAGRVISVDL